MKKETPEINIYFPDYNKNEYPEKQYMHDILYTLKPEVIADMIQNARKKRRIIQKDGKGQIKSKLNFLKGIMKLSWVLLISRPVEPSRLESPRAIWAKPGCWYHQMEKACLEVPLWFHQVCPCWVPLSVFVLRSSLRLI